MSARALPRLHSLIVSQRGEVIFERYYNRRHRGPSGQRQVGVQERDRGAGRHRHRPRADRRRAHADRHLVPGAGQGSRSAQARHHRRGPAGDALGSRGDQRPRVRGLGDQRQLGALRPDPADARRARRGHGLQHRQHAPAVGDPHPGHRRQHLALRQRRAGPAARLHAAAVAARSAGDLLRRQRDADDAAAVAGAGRAVPQPRPGRRPADRPGGLGRALLPRPRP